MASLSNNARDNRRMAFRTELPLALGCTICPDVGICGGLKVREVAFDCTALCKCNTADEQSKCQFVCPNKPREYSRRLREIASFDLQTIGNAQHQAACPLPLVIPWLDGRGCLEGPLPVAIVAIPLKRLFQARTGCVTLTGRAELERRFALAPGTRIIVTGVSFEQPIEDYWSKARAKCIVQKLAEFRLDLVTTPNFSLFSDNPRHDNLYNMKRIAICWHELASQRIRTALHLNARTDRDWERWQEFLNSHPEIDVVAFEFATGTATPERARWYVQKLVETACKNKHELSLVVRGGGLYLKLLRRHFQNVSLIATDPLIKARKRKRLELGADGKRAIWRPVQYIPGARLNDLFLHNVDAVTKLATGA